MTKITDLKQKTYQNKPNGWKIAIDNGPLENLKEKDSDKNLQVGEEVTVVVEDWINQKKEHSNLLIVKRACTQASPPSANYAPPSPQQKAPVRSSSPIVLPAGITILDIFRAKAHGTVEAMKTVASAVFDHDITWEQLPGSHAELTQLIDGAIDKICEE
ncbi:MAG TPA: hypothetical protein VMV86_05050, partial [Methanosarcinales archaeon]|nr:hypothetical protein [Methanosarcinales archaeon]